LVSDQVGRVELLGAVLALVAAGAVIAAFRAGALDIAVRQKTAVGVGIDLFLGHLLDQPGIRQPPGKVLSKLVISLRRRSPEIVE
jgi:hypothetical protein